MIVCRAETVVANSVGSSGKKTDWAGVIFSEGITCLVWEWEDLNSCFQQKSSKIHHRIVIKIPGFLPKISGEELQVLRFAVSYSGTDPDTQLMKCAVEHDCSK